MLSITNYQIFIEVYWLINKVKIYYVYVYCVYKIIYIEIQNIIFKIAKLQMALKVFNYIVSYNTTN